MSGCRCHCNPCTCPSPSGFGCVPDACVPRPCFFQGQLVTAEDLNALTTYARTKDALLARFVGGWGVAGGMRLRAVPGGRWQRLDPKSDGPHPSLVAGTRLEVGRGVAIDAQGRALTLCAPRVIDVAALATADPVAPVDRACSEWFGEDAPFCGTIEFETRLTAREYYVIAEYDETPARPAPVLAGGGACDPAPSCDFSRKLEEVRIRLVREVPPSYVLTGCLEPAKLALPDLAAARELSPDQLDDLLDGLLERLADHCCTRAAVVLGRVLLTSSPETLFSLDPSLPSVPVYTVVTDARPLRRLVPSAALSWLYASKRELGA